MFRFLPLPQMKFICSFQNGAEKFQLPIAPSEIGVSIAHNNQKININNIGEVLMIGKTGLINLDVSSFFPVRDYYFADIRYKAQRPYEYIKKLLNWKDSGRPMRLLVTDTPINHPFAIESLDYKEQDGTGDVYYTLRLQEYKFLTGQAQAVKEETELLERADEREAESITVYPGDDAMDIVLRASGGSWADCGKTICQKNIRPGDVVRVRAGNVYLET